MSSPQNNKTNDDLMKKIDLMRRRFREVEEFDQEQRKISRETMEQAQLEASRILDEAAQNAEQIRERVRQEGQADALAEQSRIEMERDDLQHEIDVLTAQKEDMVSQLSGISSQLQTVVSENMPDVPVLPASAPAAAVPVMETSAEEAPDDLDRQKADMLRELDKLTAQLKQSSMEPDEKPASQPGIATAAVPVPPAAPPTGTPEADAAVQRETDGSADGEAAAAVTTMWL